MPPDDTIPKHRLDQEIAARKAVEAQLAEAQTANAELKTQATLADRHLERATQAETELTSEREDRAINDLLTPFVSDPDVRDGFAQAWKREPEETRSTFAEWFKAKAAKPEETNGLLRPYLPTVAEDGKLVAATSSNPTAPGSVDSVGTLEGAGNVAPNVGGAAPRGGAPSSESNVTPEQIRAMISTPEGLAKYAKMRKAIGNQLGVSMPDLPSSNPYSDKPPGE